MERASNAINSNDTTYRKVFVGSLAWRTREESLQKYFEQFGEIEDVNVVTNSYTGRSKGYGFVTFKQQSSALRACVDPSPEIDGRKTTCNIASLGSQRTTIQHGTSRSTVPPQISQPATNYQARPPSVAPLRLQAPASDGAFLVPAVAYAMVPSAVVWHYQQAPQEAYAILPPPEFVALPSCPVPLMAYFTNPHYQAIHPFEHYWYPNDLYWWY